MRKALRRNARVRSVGIPIYQLGVRSFSKLPPPKVLANSMPKAGTHLLMGVLDLLPKMRYSGVHQTYGDFVSSSDGGVDWPHLERALTRIADGTYMSAHLAQAPRLTHALNRLGYRCLYMTRDPRDIVVSHAYYVTRLERHYLHQHYNSLPAMADRLSASIEGVRTDNGRRYPPIGERLASYAAWANDPSTLTVTFEDLVGRAGGGRDDAQARAVQAIADHVDRPLPSEKALQIAAEIRTPKSATFRVGRVGEWRKHFTDHHKALFKRVAGAQLVSLGYEDDDDW
jgi:sulfotransferase 6B1